MNELQIFENEEFGKIRVVLQGNEPWFIAKDICDVLELSDTGKAVGRLDLDEGSRIEIDHPQSKDKMIEVYAVNEYGLYSLVLGSRKPEAKSFKRWITHEVIPSIRKHGTYMTADTIEKVLTDPDTIIQIATNLKVERQKREAAEKQIETDRPKIVFANSVSVSHTNILISELAKLISQNGIAIGQNRLFQWLRDNKYLICRKGTDYNMPTQKSMNLGLFVIKETTVAHSGYTSISKTPKVTGKGQIYFLNKFVPDNYLKAGVAE
jgi:Prophage antirepressor